MNIYNRVTILLSSLVIASSLAFSNETNAKSLSAHTPVSNNPDIDFSTSNKLSTFQRDVQVEPIIPNESESYSLPMVEEVVNGVLKEELEHNMAPYDENAGKLINEVTSSEFTPFKLIGTRDRRVQNKSTTIHPYNTIAYLYMRWPDGSANRGTGFIIDRDSVATAGHVVYDVLRGGWATRITVRPGANGADNFPYGAFESETLYSVKGWTNDKNYDYDYGLINISGTFPSTIGRFGYGVANTSNFDGKFARITGYPADPIIDADKPLYTQWYHSGTVDLTTRKAFYDADTTGGQSGSPVYIPSENIARAIHSGYENGKNRGTRITQEVYDNLRDWASR